MGSIGEGYSNGTVYCSSFYGHFAEPVMIDDYTFEFEIKEIVTKGDRILDVQLSKVTGMHGLFYLLWTNRNILYCIGK